jgi:hypothetical protein
MIPAIPSPHDPLVPVNWRWQRARWLCESGRYIRRSQDDPFTRIARDYLLARNAARSLAEQERLA